MHFAGRYHSSSGALIPKIEIYFNSSDGTNEGLVLFVLRCGLEDLLLSICATKDLVLFSEAK